VISFINNEPEGFKVKELLCLAEAGKAELYMSIVNLVEVFYNFIRVDGLEIADEMMREVSSLPIKIIEVIDGKVFREAAKLKACYPMSLADVFLCATAKSLAATIVTKDKEIKTAEVRENITVYWLN
jgi:predicted nucleic acid-binding protein